MTNTGRCVLVNTQSGTQHYAASRLDGSVGAADNSLERLFPLGDIGDTSHPSKPLPLRIVSRSPKLTSVRLVGAGFAVLALSVPSPQRQTP